MKNLKASTSLYPIGITGEFNGDKNYLNSFSKIQVKLIQIISYCRKYNKEVVLYLDESTPFAFYHFFYAQGLSIRPVLKEDEESTSQNIIHTDNIHKFLDDNCNYIIILCDKEDKDLFEFEKPTQYYYLKDKLPSEKIITKDPNSTLKQVVQHIKPKSDPYGVFFHEELYQRVPFTYYEQIMQTKPDLNALANREFSNVSDKKIKNHRKT